MGAASRYWTIVSINAAGRLLVNEVVPLQAFFHQQFSELAGQIDVPDHPVQRQLLRLLRENSELPGGDVTSQRMAEDCLGKKQSHSLPTHDQQCQIAHRLSQQVNITLSTAAILTQLQNLAQRLRQYRVYVKVGIFPTMSIDNPETQVKADHLQPDSTNDFGEQDEQIEKFVKSYREQFLNYLDLAIEQVTCNRCNHLQRRDSQKAQKFLAALDLFYCQGKSMGELASLVGLKAQYQITRLLKLRDYRADIRQQMFKSLLSRIIEIAKEYSDPESLYNLEQKIEVALDEQLETTFCEAETEASTKRTQSSISLFAQRVCRYLNTMRDLL